MAFSLPIDQTLGASLVGFSVTCVLFGVHTLQTFTYFRAYPSDRPAYKVLVASLWLLELLHSLCIGDVIYYYTITNFTSPLVILLEEVVWTLIAQLLLGAIIGTVVKVCFAMRVWRFSNRNFFVSGLLAAFIIGQFVVSLIFIVRCWELRRITLLVELKLLASFSLGLAAFTDIATAGALTVYLRRLRTGYRPSDTLVTQLTRYAINTGALTSACSIVTTVLYDLYTSENFYFLALYFVLIKLYAVSFMCTLNTRRITRGGRGTDRDGTTSQYTGNFYMVHHKPQQLRSAQQELSISVHQEVSVLTDEERPMSPKWNVQRPGVAVVL